MATIDADAHVLESPRTWEFIDEKYRHHTPMVVTQMTGETNFGTSGNVMKAIGKQLETLMDGVTKTAQQGACLGR